MSGLHLLSAKTVRWGQRAHCSSSPHLGSIGFIQKATGQEDLIQSRDAPLQRGLLEQCCGKWTPSTTGAAPSSTHLRACTHKHMCQHTMCIQTQAGEHLCFIFHIHTAFWVNPGIVHSPMLSLALALSHPHALTNRSTLHMMLFLCFIHTAYSSLTALSHHTYTLYLSPDLDFQTIEHNHNHFTLTDRKSTK